MAAWPDRPAERWRCCDLWQRCLSNKWNPRGFAAAHGVAVPELHWAGRRVAAAPLEKLTVPSVIRPAFGAGGPTAHMIVAGRFDRAGQHLGRGVPRPELSPAGLPWRSAARAADSLMPPQGVDRSFP